MKKLFIILIFFLVIPAIIYVNQRDKLNELRRQTREEIAEIEVTVNRVLDSKFIFVRKLPHILEHLKTLLKKMETTGAFGIHVFDREEKERLYRGFFDKLIEIREQIIEYQGTMYLNEKKIKYMTSLMVACNALIHKSPATNDEEDTEKDIFAMWSRDMSQLVLTKDDLPWEEEEETAPPEQNEWAGLDIVDGIAVVPRETERKILTVENRTPVGLDRLKNYIGKEFEIQLKNGDVEEGTLLTVDARKIKLNVFLGGGRASMPIPMDGIKKAEMITVEKRIALNQTKTIVKDGPWNKYKEMAVKRLEPVTRAMKRRSPKRSIHEGYALVTNDYKMYWVSDKTGRLVAHSAVTPEKFKPLATGVEPGSISRIRLARYPGETVAGSEWVTRPKKNAAKKIKTKDLHKMKLMPINKNSKLSEFNPFELRFKIRLVKQVPGVTKKIEIEEKDLVFNYKNTRIIVKADYVLKLVESYRNGRYGEGDKPWEYNMTWEKYR